MGTEYAPKRMQGFIVPMEATFWEEESGEYDVLGNRLSELQCASPIPGEPAAGRSTEMRLRPSGTPTVTIDVEVVRSGLPCLDEVGVLAKPSTDGKSDLRGCDLSSYPARFEPLQLAGQQTSPHVITCDDGSLCQCFWKETIGIEVQRRAADGGAWSAASTVLAYAGANNPWPCLLVMPDGRLRLYYWVSSGADWQVGVFYSVDRGATWTQGLPVLVSALSGATITSLGRLRTAYGNGKVLLLGHVVENDTNPGVGFELYRDRIAQWASSDGGHLLFHVATQDGTTENRAGGWPDVVFSDGKFVVARLRYDTASNSVIASVNRLSSAWMSIDTADEVGNTGTLNAGIFVGLRTNPGGPGHDWLLADGDLALWLEDDGALDLAVRRCDTAALGPPPGMQACLVLRSADRGDTWLATGDSGIITDRGQAWYWDQLGNAYPFRFAGCFQRGRAVLVSDWYSAAAQVHAIAAWYLGGWQNRTMPAAGGTLQPTRRVAFDFPQAALALPSLQGWNLTLGGGAAAPTLASNRISIVTLPGQAVTWDRTGALFTTAQGAILEVALEVTAGTFYLRIYAHSAATRYASEVRITSTTVELWDINGGAQIGSTWTRTASGRLRIRLDQQGNDVECLIFEGNSTDEDRRWYSVAKGLNLVNAGAYAADSIEMAAGASTTALLDEWDLVYGSYTGDHAIGQAYSAKMPRSVIPNGIYTLKGLLLSAITGPAEIGDTWRVPHTWQYPPTAALPRITASPRTGMRTRAISAMAAGTVQVRVAYKIGTTETYPFGRDLGVFLDRLNAGNVGVDIYYGGAWHAMGTTGRLGFVGARRGRTVRLSSGGILYSAVVRRGELVDALVEFVTGGTSDYQMRCDGNDRGYLDTTSGASYGLTLRVADVNPAAPATPTVRVWPARHLVLKPLETLQADFMGIRLTFPVEPTPPFASPGPPPEGYIGIGCFAFGPVVYLGHAYGYGRRLRTMSGTELITTRDGTRIADVQGPMRPGVSMSWPDGVPTKRWQDRDDPDYLRSHAGGEPVGFRWDTPIDVADLVVEMQGAKVPIVVLPRIDQDDTGGLDHWARGAFLGRFTTTEIGLDNVVGQELGNEVLRLQEAEVDGEI